MPQAINQLNKMRLSDQVIDHILKLISRGKLKIGDKIQPEKNLANGFGVGRSTIREAMRALSVMGIISIKPGRGAVIIGAPSGLLKLPLKWDSLRKYPKAEEVVETRIVLEQGMMELAAKNATEDELKALQSVLDEMGKAQTNREKYIETDLSFHAGLAKATHNELLIRLYNEIRPLIRTWLERQIPYISDKHAQRAFQRHKLILQTIKDRSPLKARQLVRQHIEKD